MTIATPPGAALLPPVVARRRPSTRGYWIGGRAVATFRPSQVGTYQIGSAPTTGVAGTLAVGGDIVRDAVPHALGAGALFLLGGGAGVAVLIVTAVRRDNDARR
jgi:hypothetical protein